MITTADNPLHLAVTAVKSNCIELITPPASSQNLSLLLQQYGKLRPKLKERRDDAISAEMDSLSSSLLQL